MNMSFIKFVAGHIPDAVNVLRSGHLPHSLSLSLFTLHCSDCHSPIALLLTNEGFSPGPVCTIDISSKQQLTNLSLSVWQLAWCSDGCVCCMPEASPGGKRERKTEGEAETAERDKQREMLSKRETETEKDRWRDGELDLWEEEENRNCTNE